MDLKQFLIRFMKGSYSLYFLSLLMVALIVILTYLPPVIIGFTVDSIIGGKPIQLPTFIPNRVVTIIQSLGSNYLLQNIWLCGSALVVISLFTGTAMFFRSKCTATAAETIAKTARDELFAHMQHLPFAYHATAKTGDLIQRCTSDIEVVRKFLEGQLIEILRAIILVAVSIFFMIKIDVPMTIVSFVMVPFIFAFCYLYFKSIQKYFKEVDEAEAKMSNVLQENLTGVRVVRAFAKQQYESQKFETENTEYRKLHLNLIRRIAVFWSVSDGMSIIQHGLVVVAGTFWAAQGRITIGTLIVFISYVGMMLWPVRQVGRMLSELSQTTVSAKRIMEIMNEPSEDMNSMGLKPSMREDIVFNNISFGYEEHLPVLKNVSFEVKKGQTIAILGAAGSGKSSLIYLLQRLYDYHQGSITIGGVELKDINKNYLREHVGLVLQEPFLFSGTIEENIKLANVDANWDDMVMATDTASVHHVIEAFEKGYQTVVGERGVTLSGGQKQRVAIARTLIKESDILIFDDSLSAVDTQTDANIREALDKRSKHTTTFIISHRLTTIANADRILVLEEGELVDIGTHEELIRRPGLYQRVWDIQNSLEEELA